MRNLIVLLLLSATFTFATTVTTTVPIVRPDNGNLFSGRVIFQLPQFAINSSTNQAVMPTPATANLVNGKLTASLSLIGNDILAPKMYYQARYYDVFGAYIGNVNYYINGSTFDLGSAPTTPITTNNVSFNVLPNLQLVSSAIFQNVHYMVDQQPGANLGEKLTSCLAALPPTGTGWCDATSVTGSQSSSISVNCNRNDTLISLGQVQWSSSVPHIIISAQRCAVVGLPVRGASALITTSTTSDLIDVNSSYWGIENLAFASANGIVRTGGAGLNVGQNNTLGGHGYANNLLFGGVYNSIWVSTGAGGGTFNNVECAQGNGFPLFPRGTVDNSCIKIGPVATGTVTSSTFTNLIVAGDWLDAGIVLDSGSDSNIFQQVQGSCGVNSTSIHIKNSLAGNPPDLTKFSNGTLESCGTGSTVVIDAAQDTEFDNFNIGCANLFTCAHNLVINSGANNTKFRGGDLGGANQECAIIDTNGGVDISHTRILDCSTQANNGFAAISVLANRSNVRIQDNEFKSVLGPVNTPSNSVNIAAGTGDRIFISGNNFNFSVGAALINGATGANNQVWHNVGDTGDNRGSATLGLNATTFATLGTPTNGTLKYCNDCTVANPCAGAGTGALAKRLNGVWVCN